MGLIKKLGNTVGDGVTSAIGDVVGSGLGAVGGAFSSALFAEYFESGDMSDGILMKRGEKIVTEKSKNARSDDNLISSGSGIDVQENQCVILIQNGQITEFCTEPGRYSFDDSIAPSLLCGDNKGLKAFGKEILNQWKAGGQRFSTQRVYYINMGEIEGFKWGSGNISFMHCDRDLATDKPIWQCSTTLQGNGTYTIRIGDPVKFFKVLGASVAGTDGDGVVHASKISDQMKTEVIGKIRQAIGGLSQLKIPYTDIPNHEAEIVTNLNELMSETWSGLRGIEVYSFAIGMLDPDDESKARIVKFQETKGYTDPSMLAAQMGLGATEAMKTAAGNEAGAAVGFMGMGMAGNVMGGISSGVGQMMQQGQEYNRQQAAVQQTENSADSWVCACGAKNTGAFCSECGAKKPADAAGWTCACGAVNKGKFCSECGAKKPADALLYKCDKCGWEPEDPKNPPKFCPQCGDPFTEADHA